jgi:hypothetical protein
MTSTRFGAVKLLDTVVHFQCDPNRRKSPWASGMIPSWLGFRASVVVLGAVPEVVTLDPDLAPDQSVSPVVAGLPLPCDRPGGSPPPRRRGPTQGTPPLRATTARRSTRVLTVLASARSLRVGGERPGSSGIVHSAGSARWLGARCAERGSGGRRHRFRAGT